jgi:hypothetical protein
LPFAHIFFLVFRDVHVLNLYAFTWAFTALQALNHASKLLSIPSSLLQKLLLEREVTAGGDHVKILIGVDEVRLHSQLLPTNGLFLFIPSLFNRYPTNAFEYLNIILNHAKPTYLLSKHDDNVSR